MMLRRAFTAAVLVASCAHHHRTRELRTLPPAIVTRMPRPPCQQHTRLPPLAPDPPCELPGQLRSQFTTDFLLETWLRMPTLRP